MRANGWVKAEEIFAEIEKLKYNGWSDVNVYPCIDYVGLAELKKKYESEV